MKKQRYKESRFTQELIRKLIDYDPVTGVATWRQRGYELCDPKNGGFNSSYIALFNLQHAGNDITTVDGRGYITTSIKAQKMALHRIIFIYMTGMEPIYADHINGVKTDNCWSNLRAVTETENKQNIGRKKGKSGYTGVTEIEMISGIRYRARIRVDGSHKHLGMFETAEEAAIAYNNGIDKHRNGYGRKNVVLLSEPT